MSSGEARFAQTWGRGVRFDESLRLELSRRPGDRLGVVVLF